MLQMRVTFSFLFFFSFLNRSGISIKEMLNYLKTILLAGRQGCASWHTMAVISCPVLFTHFPEFLLGINTLGLGGRVWMLLTLSSCRLGAHPCPQIMVSAKNPEFWGLTSCLSLLGWLSWFGTVGVDWGEMNLGHFSHLQCPSIAPFSCKLPPLQLSVGLAWRMEGRAGSGRCGCSSCPGWTFILQGIICSYWVQEWKQMY